MNPLFKYHTKDKNGSDKDGVIEASDERQAVEKLQSMGLTVILLEKMNQEDKPSSDKAETQICPYCKESVKKGADKCPHCQSNLFIFRYPKVLIGIFLGGLLYFFLPHPDVLTKGGGIDFDNLWNFFVNGITWVVIGGVIGGIYEASGKLKRMISSAYGKFAKAKLTAKCFIISLGLCFIGVVIQMFSKQSLWLWDFSRNLLVVGLSLTLITGIIKKLKK